MAGELVDKGIDDDERDDAPPRSRKGLYIGVAAAVAAVAAGALAIARPWSDSGSGDIDASETTDRAVDEPIEPTLPHTLVLGETPEGFAVDWVTDGEEGGFEDFGGPLTETTNVLLVAPGATVTDGRWLSVRVVTLDGSDLEDFDPEIFTAGEETDSVAVGAMRGAYVAEGFDGSAQLVFGPMNERFLVSLTGKGFPRDELVALGAEMQLDEEDDGAVAWPAFSDRLGDLEPMASYRQPGTAFLWSTVYSFLGATSPTATSVSYSSNDEDGVQLINDTLIPGLDVLEVARFVIADPIETTVHGLPAVTGSMQDVFGGEMVMWVEGGRSVVVFASGDIDVVALAESVRAADAAEWSALIDGIEVDIVDPGSDEPTWLIGVGDLEDGTTWLIEGSINDEGDLELCVDTLSRDGSSTASCESGTTIDGPAIIDIGSIDNFGPVVGLVAVAPVNNAGAVLRFTAAGGEVTEVELLERRPDWPFHAAAIAVAEPGTLDLVAADGTVLATDEITEDDVAGVFG